MGRFNPRSVFSLPLVIISSVKKIKLDGFLGGLLIGALFSMVVNLVTVQVQETITKQRVLEAVEWEIFNNSSLASNVINEAGKIFKEGRSPTMYYVFPSYSRDLWEQSIDPLLYIAQLPSEIQAKVITYYTTTIKGYNEMSASNRKMAEVLLSGCYTVYESVDDKKMTECKYIYNELVKINMEMANDVLIKSFEVLDSFHPTKDRLNNLFLRLMMGGDSVRVLSGT